ncbi:40-residue YVTN family beta-propeller, partial [Bacillus toyonensis]
INTASNTVVATVPVGFGPIGVAITPNGQFAYVTSTSSKSLYKINTVTNTVVATILSDPTHSIAITPNGQFAYVVTWPLLTNNT